MNGIRKDFESDDIKTVATTKPTKIPNNNGANDRRLNPRTPIFVCVGKIETNN